MDVKAVLVMLAVLLQASGQIFNFNLEIGGTTGGRGTADKSQKTVMAERLKQTEGLHQDPVTGTWLSQLDILDMSDTGRSMLITLLFEQNKKMQKQITELQERDKDMQGQIKDLKLDHCITKKTCCNKTLTCPSGYERFCEKPDMCYKFFTDKKNYTKAKSVCKAPGGHLVMPKDKATNDFLHKQAVARYNTSYVWIGLTDQVIEGTWVWEDGATLGTGWYNDQATSSDCAVIGYNKWAVMTCTQDMNYICEKKATAAP
ncbi:Collectin-11 [Branchiostoma belcheri]|nr:Collectin-11 [Branchiostoma belcheri]